MRLQMPGHIYLQRKERNMPSYLHPGVYVEEIPSGSRPIEGVATSVAAFITMQS